MALDLQFSFGHGAPPLALGNLKQIGRGGEYMYELARDSILQ